MMVTSDDIAEVLRLGDLETKAWGYFAKGKARGSAHTEMRAMRLLHAAHCERHRNKAATNVVWWK